MLRTTATGTGGTLVTGVRRWQTATGGTTYEVGERGRDWFNQNSLRTRAEYSFSKNVFASLQYMRQQRSEGWDAYRTWLRDASGNAVDNGVVAFDDGGVIRRLSVTSANFIGTPTGAVNHIVQTQVLATISPSWNLRVAAGLNRSPGDWYVTPGAAATLSSGSGSLVNQTSQSLYGNAQASWQRSGTNLIFGSETRHDRARIASQTIPNYAVRADGGPYDSQGLGRAVNQAAYVQYQHSVGENLNVVAGGRWDYWKTYNGATQTGLERSCDAPLPDALSAPSVGTN